VLTSTPDVLLPPYLALERPHRRRRWTPPGTGTPAASTQEPLKPPAVRTPSTRFRSIRKRCWQTVMGTRLHSSVQRCGQSAAVELEDVAKLRQSKLEQHPAWLNRPEHKLSAAHLFALNTATSTRGSGVLSMMMSGANIEIVTGGGRSQYTGVKLLRGDSGVAGGVHGALYSPPLMRCASPSTESSSFSSCVSVRIAVRGVVGVVAVMKARIASHGPSRRSSRSVARSRSTFAQKVAYS
jgi:hypothetical protein